jgi:hypothetical protein
MMSHRTTNKVGTMIKITPVMKDLLDKALADGTPCLIGTA